MKPAGKPLTKALSVLLSILTFFAAFISVSAAPNAAHADEENRVVIYSSAEDYRNEHFLARLNEQFPDYEIVIEYMSTGNQAAKLQAEGTSTECDISVDMEYGYYPLIEDNLAELSDYDFSQYTDDMISASRKYLPMYRNGGAIIVNIGLLADYGIPLPTCYNDLLKPEYEGLVSMPNPKSSGTGYIFLKSLVNAWGEDAAFDYFDALAQNVQQFTSSGSGPVNALVLGEAAVGLGITAQAVMAINEGAPLKILFFEEGSPYTGYGCAIIKGKEARKCVKDVFDFFYTDLIEENSRLFTPEPIYKNKVFEVDNFPTDISYADMSGNTTDEKLRLLDMWEY